FQLREIGVIALRRDRRRADVADELRQRVAMTFVMAFEQHGDFQGVRDKKAAAASNSIRRDPRMLTGERSLYDFNILRNVVWLSHDTQNNLLFRRQGGA